MIFRNFVHQVESMEIPTKPSLPSLFNKQVKDLTPDEIAEIPKLKQAYDIAMSSYKEALAFNQNWRSQLLKEFHSALAEEYGETIGSIRENHIWESASSERNYYEIECKYSELSGVPR